MKKILTTIAALFLATTIGAREIKHVIYLNNGDVVKGRIIEQVPEKSIKVRMTDGRVIEYSMSEVSKITQEAKTKVPEDPNGKHYGLDVSIGTGCFIGVGDFKKAKMIPVELSLGKQINKNFYVGGSTGAWICPDAEPKVSIPINIDTRLMLDRVNTFTPFLDLSLGYLINPGGIGPLYTDSEFEQLPEDIRDTYDNKSIDYPDAITMQIMPGVKLPVSKNTDFYVKAGYTHRFGLDDGLSGGYFSVKTGVMFHKNPNRPFRKRRLPVATRNNGFQWTTEAGVGFGELGGGGDMIFGYKINPHFSAGIGLGYYRTDPFSYDDGKTSEMIYIDKDGSAHTSEYYMEGPVSTVKTYLRGVYRMTDRRFSPLISCDAGINFYKYEDDVYGWGNEMGKDVLGNPSKIGFFAAPAIGISLRTTKNSYLELKGGYSFTPNILGKKASSEINGVKHYGSCISTKMSHPFITLGFTHTFGKRGDKR